MNAEQRWAAFAVVFALLAVATTDPGTVRITGLAALGSLVMVVLEGRSARRRR